MNGYERNGLIFWTEWVLFFAGLAILLMLYNGHRGGRCECENCNCTLVRHSKPPKGIFVAYHEGDIRLYDEP